MVEPVDTGEYQRTDHLRLTYRALGERLGISSEAARMLARRKGWQKIAPNHPAGSVVLLIPSADLDDEAWREGRDTPNSEPRTPPVNSQTPPDTGVLQHVLDALRTAHQGELTAVKAERDRMAVLMEQTQARADRAEQALTGERQRSDALRERLDAAEGAKREAEEASGRARTEAQAARQDAEQLRQADDTRRARGRWARLRDAWRGS